MDVICNVNFSVAPTATKGTVHVALPFDICAPDDVLINVAFAGIVAEITTFRIGKVKCLLVRV